MKSWDELKREGSAHYRNTDDLDIQPIDLYRSMGVFHPWALVEICQHALRNIEPADLARFERDMDKIIHYAELLKAEKPDRE